MTFDIFIPCVQATYSLVSFLFKEELLSLSFFFLQNTYDGCRVKDAFLRNCLHSLTSVIDYERVQVWHCAGFAICLHLDLWQIKGL